MDNLHNHEEDEAPFSPDLNIEIDDETAEGEYCNLVMIAHSPEEFVLDFIRMVPGLPKMRVKSRIIITPQHAKRLLAALEDNIEKYEQVNGAIQSPNGGFNPFAFHVPSGEA
jgi:hypothetical protein